MDRYFAQEVSDGHTRGTILKLTALLHDIAKPRPRQLSLPGESVSLDTLRRESR